jgi:ubiquinone/menaquinone biosynthesis C-methylase UbiE
MGRHVTAAIVDFAAIQSGMRVLDLASGTGEPAISIAERVGPSGHVVATDVNPEVLNVAAYRAERRGLTNITFRATDAHKLPFEDATFDRVTSRFGIMFFSDVVGAMREAHRVLKPSGCIALAAWGRPDQPFFDSMAGTVARMLGVPMLPPDSQNPFRFAQQGSLSHVLGEAGFVDVREEHRTLPWSWPGTAAGVYEHFRDAAVPLRPIFDRIPRERAEEFNRAVLQAVERYRNGDHIDFAAEVVLCFACRE